MVNLTHTRAEGINEACKDTLEKGMDYLNMRNLKVEYIKEAVKKKMMLFGLPTNEGEWQSTLLRFYYL